MGQLSQGHPREFSRELVALVASLARATHSFEDFNVKPRPPDQDHNKAAKHTRKPSSSKRPFTKWTSLPYFCRNSRRSVEPTRFWTSPNYHISGPSYKKKVQSDKKRGWGLIPPVLECRKRFSRLNSTVYGRHGLFEIVERWV